MNKEIKVIVIKSPVDQIGGMAEAVNEIEYQLNMDSKTAKFHIILAPLDVEINCINDEDLIRTLQVTKENIDNILSQLMKEYNG